MSATILTAPGRVNTAGGMITFALVPVRSRTLGAKLVASIMLALTMLVMSVAIVAAGCSSPRRASTGPGPTPRR
jgi:hypothetical protein